MSEQVKVAVVYYSSTGTVYNVAEATAEDILWADAVNFGSPPASATSPASSNSSSTHPSAHGCKGQLADKVYSGFTATGTAHGGQESTRPGAERRLHVLTATSNW